MGWRDMCIERDRDQHCHHRLIIDNCDCCRQCFLCNHGIDTTVVQTRQRRDKHIRNPTHSSNNVVVWANQTTEDLSRKSLTKKVRFQFLPETNLCFRRPDF